MECNHFTKSNNNHIFNLYFLPLHLLLVLLQLFHGVCGLFTHYQHGIRAFIALVAIVSPSSSCFRILWFFPFSFLSLILVHQWLTRIISITPQIPQTLSTYIPMKIQQLFLFLHCLMIKTITHGLDQCTLH